MITTIAMAALIATLLVIGLLAGLNRYLHRSLAAPREPLQGALGDHDLTGKTVRIATRKSRQLAGWWLPGHASRGSIVIAHGWGTNREVMLPLARPLQAEGWNVLLFDMRNHGESDGDDFSSMPRFAEDIEAGVDWIRAQPGHADDPVGLLGHSVGGAAALLAASGRDDIAAVVSLSTFAHPVDMMRRWLKWKKLPFIPVGWYVLRYVERVIGHRFDAIAPIYTLPRIRCPVLLVHGRDDPVIPAADAERLHAHRGATPTTLRLLPGQHDLSEHLETHFSTLHDFLEEAVACRESTDRRAVEVRPSTPTR